MKKMGRNDPCLCEIGKKYKKCCMEKDIETGKKSLDMNKGNNNFKAFASSSGEGGLLEVKYMEFNGAAINFENPAKIMANGSETCDSGGESILTCDQAGKIETYQSDAGGVVFNDSPSYKIALRSNRITLNINDNWKLKIRIKKQLSDSFEYFDILFINRKRDRNGDDPHITFRFDGSGKFIRFGSYSDSMKFETLSESVIDRLVVPRKTQIKFEECIVVINYSFKAGVLYIDKVQI